MALTWNSGDGVDVGFVGGFVGTVAQLPFFVGPKIAVTSTSARDGFVLGAFYQFGVGVSSPGITCSMPNNLVGIRMTFARTGTMTESLVLNVWRDPGFVPVDFAALAPVATAIITPDMLPLVSAANDHGTFNPFPYTQVMFSPPVIIGALDPLEVLWFVFTTTAGFAVASNISIGTGGDIAYVGDNFNAGSAGSDGALDWKRWSDNPPTVTTLKGIKMQFGLDPFPTVTTARSSVQFIG